MTLVGEMHSQLGPSMKALVVANGNVEQAVKDQVEKKMVSSSMKHDAPTVPRLKSCLITSNGTGESVDEGGTGFEIPKTDLVASLPPDCIKRMVSFLYDSFSFMMLSITLLIIFNVDHRI